MIVPTVWSGPDESRLFGPLYPLLSAFPTVEGIAIALPAWHRWHRRPDRLLHVLELEAVEGEIICVQRIEETVGWDADNVVVVDAPAELLPYLLIEHAAWLSAHGFEGAAP